MLFRLDQTSPKAWLGHLPSLWASWMIHIGPWDWEWTTDHVMEILLHMQSWHALTCMRSWVKGVAVPLTLLEAGAFPAKTLQALSGWHCNVIFHLLFLGTSHPRNWSADQANSLHLHKSQARRETPALWWVYECCQAEQERVSGVTERSDPTSAWVLIGSASTEQILKYWESEIKCAIY